MSRISDVFSVNDQVITGHLSLEELMAVRGTGDKSIDEELKKLTEFIIPIYIS